ncbi:MAG: hypothetical protein L3K09_00645 [Thermoplasmata archaeon]|nr:hypothetical protein [Thermoplasmata archaeon]
MAGVPLPTARRLEELLGELFIEAGEPRPKLRIIRGQGRRLLVEVDQFVASRARLIWNASVKGPRDGTMRLSTSRTWGTLRKGKLWLRTPDRTDAETYPGR